MKDFFQNQKNNISLFFKSNTMKKYSSLSAFSKNRNTTWSDENYSPFYKGYWENCVIGSIPCIAYVVYFNKEGKEIIPHKQSGIPDSVKYFFRFDPGTDVQYQKYNNICEQYGNPEWITLS